MIKINGQNYKICLFDTNALSQFIKYPKDWYTYFESKFSISDTIISYSAYTLSELWYRNELFDEYLNLFGIFPSAILDGYDSIFIKEIENYTTPNKPISPIVAIPSAIKDPNLSPREKLEYVIENSGFKIKTELWRKRREEILNGILSLKDNYKPEGDKYSIKEIEQFVFMVATSQIGIRNMKFAKKTVRKSGMIELNRFPSVKSTVFLTFYKFYLDQRKNSPSDIMDLIIGSLFPYVDIVITEGGMADHLNQIKRRHNFLTDLEVISIRDVQRSILRV